MYFWGFYSVQSNPLLSKTVFLKNKNYIYACIYIHTHKKLKGRETEISYLLDPCPDVYNS